MNLLHREIKRDGYKNNPMISQKAEEKWERDCEF
jgi:hypothetical protein